MGGAETRPRSAKQLARQLRVVVGALVLALYVVALLATAVGSRRAAEAAFTAATAEAAHALAGVLADPVGRGDRPAVEAAVDAVLARCDAREVSVATPAADPWVRRERAAQTPSSPAWLATLLPVAASAATVEIAGPAAVARVQVVADPAAAQDRVWAAVVGAAKPAAIAALVLLLLAWGAVGVLARPLSTLEVQARAALDWEGVPAVPAGDGAITAALAELGRRSRLLLAGVQGLASTLHERASRDPLTGLLTRGWLLDVLEYRRRDPEQAWTGALLLARVDGIKGVNDTFGYAAGDDVLRESARLLEDTLGRGPDVLIAHLAGGEFAAFVPCPGPAAARQRATELNAALALLPGRLRFPSSLVTSAGGAYFHGQTVSALFAEADRDLRKTEWRHVPGGAGHDAAAPRPRGEEPGRRDAAQAALRAGGLRLVLQPVVAFGSRAMLHQEAYARICDVAGTELLPIGEFLAAGDPAVAVDVDRAVVTEALRRLAERSDGPDLAVNLSPGSLHVAGMVDWLAAAAGASPAAARRLILELPDPAIQAEGQEVAALAERLGPLGVRIAVDHFGTGAASFEYLHRLPLCHLKLDSAFAARLERHADTRSYIWATAQIAHSLGIPVYVQAVESEAQWEALDGLGVDGAQGYHLGRPT